MTSQHKTEIALSKSKLVKGLIGSIVFVFTGCWLLIFQPVIGNAVFDNPVFKYGIAAAAILFFGFTVIFFARKLGDKKPGVVLDEKGFYDNSSAVFAGFIPWSDVTHITTATVMKQSFLIVGVNNPEHYINQPSGFLKKKGMEYNYSNYGSPIAISANGLSCTLDELFAIFSAYLVEYRKRSGID